MVQCLQCKNGIYVILSRVESELYTYIYKSCLPYKCMHIKWDKTITGYQWPDNRGSKFTDNTRGLAGYITNRYHPSHNHIGHSICMISRVNIRHFGIPVIFLHFTKMVKLMYIYMCVVMFSLLAMTRGEAEKQDSDTVDQEKVDYAKGSVCQYCDYCKVRTLTHSHVINTQKLNYVLSLMFNFRHQNFLYGF